MTLIADFICGMPKAELHIHIEGVLEPDLMLKFAKRNGVDLGFESAEELAASYAFSDLTGFLKLYFSGIEVIRTKEDFYELTLTYLKRVHAQNVLYTEMHFDPQAHTTRGIAFDDVISGIRQAQEDAERETGIRSKLIMAFLREMSVESAMETLDQASQYKDWIVGVGLDSEEEGNPPIKFKQVFERARQEGYKLTMHCDHNQENSVQHIWQCVNDIGVDRVDHAVNAIDDDELIEEIRKRNLCLTVCPTSTPTNPEPRTAQSARAKGNAGKRRSRNRQFRRSIVPAQ